MRVNNRYDMMWFLLIGSSCSCCAKSLKDRQIVLFMITTINVISVYTM